MKFIVLLLIFGMNRYWVGTHPLYRDEWMERMQAWITDRELVTDLSPESRMVILIGVPVVVALLVFWLVRDWLFGLVWIVGALCVLAFAVDISKLGTRLQQHLQWLKGIKPSDDLDDASAYHEQFKRMMIYEEFEGLYPQVFWFALVGPAGALLYRLAAYFSADERNEEDAAELPSEGDLVQILEWIPARITAIGFAVVGDFTATVGGWVGSLADWRTPSGESLADLADSATDAREGASEDVTQFVLRSEREVFQLRDLLNRTLIFWLGLIALSVLLGWS